MNKNARNAAKVLLLMLLPGLVAAQNLAEFEKNVSVFTLKNGAKFIVVERPEAPVVSFYTYADVGSVNEVKGITGMAHVFEHMAFKGTPKIGSKDYEKEKEAMKREDDAFNRLRQERNKGDRANPEELKRLEKEFEAAKQAAQQLAKSSEFTEAIEQEGGVGINASTSSDATDYFYSLPSNKVELWFSLESERFLNPVLREFYSEKDVVMEERRMRTESNPTGRLVEEFIAASFKAHPYGEPTVGHMSDLQTMTRSEAEAFFKEYYGSRNLTFAVVGDVKTDEIKQLAEKYFGRLPDSGKPEEVETLEPEQLGERRIIVEDQAQPFLVIGYQKGNIHHPDEVVFSVLSDVLGRGRASRLHKNLVKEKRIAITATGSPGFPGLKYKNLMIFFAIPTPGHTTEECEKAIYDEIEKLKSQPVSAEELKKAKTRARADVIRQLASNDGIAQVLPFYETVTGDWRNVFRELERIEKVTAQDIQRVARQYLIPKHRTVASIQTVQKQVQQ